MRWQAKAHIGSRLVLAHAAGLAGLNGLGCPYRGHSNTSTDINEVELLRGVGVNAPVGSKAHTIYGAITGRRLICSILVWTRGRVDGANTRIQAGPRHWPCLHANTAFATCPHVDH